jgi:hypothetical protein
VLFLDLKMPVSIVFDYECLCYIVRMGMHDRDYYREDYAKKNGMSYQRKNATYSAGRHPRWRVASSSWLRSFFPGLFRPSPFRLLLRISVTGAVCMLLVVIVRVISRVYS